MPTYLSRLLEYETWANDNLLDFIAAREPATLDLTTGGVYGSIGATFEHLLRSHIGYGRQLSGLPRIERPELGRPQMDDLRKLAEESAAIAPSLEASLPDPAARVTTRTGDRAAATILTQLITHGAEHRAHIGSILGANGIEPPDLDSWAHGIFVHGDPWPPEWGPEPEVRVPPGRG